MSIVSFNSQAVLHADHAPGGAKTVLEQALKNYLNDSGATNFEAAIKMAQSVAGKGKPGNYKIIFLTDGMAVSGNSQNAQQICRELADRGVTTDAMGIGADFDFDFMKRFSDCSGSLTENISKQMSAAQVFRRIYTNTANTFLKKVFINVYLDKAVRDVHFYMHVPEQKNLSEFIHQSNDGAMVQINAGDIEQQSFKEFLFDFTLDTPSETSMKLGECVIHFDCPSRSIKNMEQRQQLYLNFADDPGEEIIDSSIEAAYKDIEILEKQNELFRLMKQNKYQEAALRLEDMANLAEKIGDHDKARGFREKKNKVMRDHNLTQADLNDIAYSSSRNSVTSIIRSKQQDMDPIF